MFCKINIYFTKYFIYLYSINHIWVLCKNVFFCVQRDLHLFFSFIYATQCVIAFIWQVECKLCGVACLESRPPQADISFLFFKCFYLSIVFGISAACLGNRSVQPDIPFRIAFTCLYLFSVFWNKVCYWCSLKTILFLRLKLYLHFNFILN